MQSKKLRAGFVLVFIGCGDAAIQPADARACDSCELRLQRVVELGSPSDPAGPDLIVTAAAVDVDGQWYVVPGAPGAEVLVYGPDGRYRRSIGRRGDGPGELNGVSHLSLAGDTIRVFSNSKLTRFTRNGEYLSSRRFPVLGGRAYFGPAREIIVYRPDTDQPFRAVDTMGHVTSFGPPRADRTTGARLQAATFYSPDSVWVANADEYRLELWTRRGGPVRTIERRPKWFPWPQEVRKAILHDLWIDSSSNQVRVSLAHLWRGRLSPAEPAAVSIVEVLDLASGHLVASDSVAGWPPLTFTDQGDLYRVEEGAEGHTLMTIFRPVLSMPSHDSRRSN